ncbi:MAG: hypothetical protein U9Q70_00935 [Chloroflexota bacterium]|nr:hypothetical protein [Chloroflexota bacterium]
MNDPISNQTAYLLAKKPNIFTPLERLYNVLADQGLMSWITLEDYRHLLETDGRFAVFAGLSEALTGDTFASDASLGLGVLDFLTGPWVLLRTRRFSTTEVMQELLLYLHQMNEVLETTWHRLPNMPESEQTKDNLLHMLMWGDLLEHQLRDTLTGPEKTESGN